MLSAPTAPNQKVDTPALELLDSRFDRATGAAKAQGDWETPAVQVTVAVEPEPMPPRKRVRGIDPLAIARLLTRRL